MGFLKFVTSFWYRQQLHEAYSKYQNIKPPANPTRRYIDRLVARLLNKKVAWSALRELEMLGEAVVPSLLAALNDSRFHLAEWEEFYPVPPPLDSTLELLVDHSPADVATICSRFTSSPVPAIRKVVALHLASAGRSNSIGLLLELVHDDDVRDYICLGICRAIVKQRAEEDFKVQTYKLLLSQSQDDSSVLTKVVADTIILLDPAKAAVDLADEHFLSFSNKKAHYLIAACNRENISLPEHLIRPLLNAALAQVSGEDCYPNDVLAVEALHALAQYHAEETESVAKSLLNHENKTLKVGMAELLAKLAGISRLEDLIINQIEKVGYESLTDVQRVIYCAFIFDAEVCNGGLLQFFGNSSGDYAEDTLAALSELGHQDGFDALESAMRIVGPLSRESNRELRLSAFEGRSNELQAAFGPLENMYYESPVSLRACPKSAV